jgi:hypothetical protein
LQHSDFGFVYQVLSYERIHGETQSSKSAEINRYLSAGLNDLIQYGPFYLTKEEFKRELKKALYGYHQFLGLNLFLLRRTEFWDYHKMRLQELGYPMKLSMLLRALIIKVLREFMNPEQAVRKIIRRYSSGSRHSTNIAARPSSDIGKTFEMAKN